ncbi:hypothetical protein P171DRAFT_167092 [Karstenula rhodostoma CBS 690.94]|uniref:Secreted protein n=1 Tax=Karstenula rhodostoma CBS 690.94 TaxID=1392251 RepID=A0A9P4P735_9PLEO|nr:hypothetical protein P171DRAFT_167092 [Karstenula rhodostoma CBS 690.94]
MRASAALLAFLLAAPRALVLDATQMAASARQSRRAATWGAGLEGEFRFDERRLSHMYCMHWCTLRKGVCASIERWLLCLASVSGFCAPELRRRSEA